MEWILPLYKVNLAHANTVGGKAARLGALMQAGFNVPTGFVITSDAFSRHYPILLDEKPPPPTLDADFVSTLNTAFIAHFEPDEVVAVRSSAIDEDGAGISYAGQHATYYYITAERLSQAVVDCWMSLWSPAALAYRENWDESTQPMAVIVQRLVKATRSGVCFSRDPLEPEAGNIIIEASWGLGAALVDGRVQPDRIKVDPFGHVTVLQIGDKQLMVPGQLDDPAQGRLDPVPEHLRTAPVLSTRDAVALHETTEQIEALFAEAVDVEWAFDEDELHVLQARPITASAPTPADGRALVLFKPVAENFSEPLTPLTVDLVTAILPKIGAFVGGRLYLDFDVLNRLIPYHLSNSELVDIAMLRRAPQTPRLAVAKLPAAIAVLALGWLSFGTFWTRSSRLEAASLARFVPWLQALQHDPSLDVPGLMKHTLLGRFPWSPAHESMLALNISAGRYFLLIGVLQSLLKRWAPAYDPMQIDDVIHDDTDMWSKRMVRSITELAALAATHEDTRVALLANDATIGIRELDPSHPFVIALGVFISAYGHRGARELDFSAPRWREDITPLLTMIRNQMLHADQTNDSYSRHLVARDALRKAIGSGLKWRLVNKLLSRIRYYIGLRENTRHYHTMIFDAIRQRLLLIENELLHSGKLKCAGDMFFLSWDEVQAASTGAVEAQTISRTIRERRIAHRREARSRAPETFNVKLPIADIPTNERTLHGQCASPGVIEGIARVILRPDHAQLLKPGEILVAPYTDPTWTPLFPSLGGIVVGIGSYLSHAGTIAREYRIPCLVDVHDCILRIRSGQRLRLHATEGFVELLEDDA